MRPAFAFAPGMGSNPTFCQLDYTSNGILVRYQEAQKRRRRMPSALGGLDMSYFQMIFEIIAQQTGGGEDWEDDKKQKKLDNIKQALMNAKKPTEDKYTDDWVTVEKTVFCTSMEEVPAAIKLAYEAHVGIMSIQKDGDTVMPGEMGASYVGM
jgi:hypothetical protein